MEDLYVLLHNIRHVYAAGDNSHYLVPDEALTAFIRHCAQRLGAESYQTPREAAKGFVELLSVLEQNPGTAWQTLLGDINLQPSRDPDNLPTTNDDVFVAPNNGHEELATFHL